jgi:hypothetical protein
MTKRNLIVIAIIGLVMLFAGNAFGQRKNRQAKATTQSILSSPQTPRRRQYNPKEYSIEKLKNSKPPVQAAQPNNYIGETEKNIKKPTTRRQNNRSNTAAPTNSLMTIPTDVPNIKTKKPATNRSANRSNALPTNQTPKIKSKTKKPVKPFTGGTDDGQSI